MYSKNALKEYISLLSPFQKEATIALTEGKKPETLAKFFAKRNKMSLKVARAHVTRAVYGLQELADNGKISKESRKRTSATPAQTQKTVRKVKIKSYSDLVALAKASGQTIVITLRPTRKRNQSK